MQSRTRFLLYSVAYDGWLNKLSDGHTSNMFSALWFSTSDQAQHWLETYDKAPKDKENYEIQETLTTMEVIENERTEESISENQPGYAGHSVFAKG